MPLLRPLCSRRRPTLASRCTLRFQGYAALCQRAAGRCKLVRRHRINVVCVGELVAGSWLGIALRKAFGTRLMIYVHGEEITTAAGGRLHGNKRRDYLHAADKVIAVSSFTCDALTQQMGLRAGAGLAGPERCRHRPFHTRRARPRT